MSRRALEEFEAGAAEREAERAAAKAEREETEKRRALKRAVKAIIPKHLRVPQRHRGRPLLAGVSRKEVEALRRDAERFLSGPEGLKEFERAALRNALVVLMIDGLIGTEPWRAANHAHGGMISANARLRYLDNAARLLSDLRKSMGDEGSGSKLLEGVIEAEKPAADAPAAEAEPTE